MKRDGKVRVGAMVTPPALIAERGDRATRKRWRLMIDELR